MKDSRNSVYHADLKDIRCPNSRGNKSFGRIIPIIYNGLSKFQMAWPSITAPQQQLIICRIPVGILSAGKLYRRL